MFDEFYKSLKRKRSDYVFNPWYDFDLENDQNNFSPQQRLNNLKLYLNERQNAKYLLVAEALGYQGGHFSGIPMTSERIILGHKKHEGIFPEHVCQMQLSRTSKIKIKRNGFTEPTATIVWKKLIEKNLNTRDFIFWNSFPWHPYNISEGMLSNRTPTKLEIEEGIIVLKKLLNIIPFKKIIALGNEANDLLHKIGFNNVIKVRHPANGGATLFREQFEKSVEI